MEKRISSRLGRNVRVVFTDNRYSLLSVREKPGGICTLRIHHMFRNAPGEIVNALADYLISKKNRKASDAVDQYITENLHKIRRQSSKAETRMRPRGTFFDLREIYQKINREYFGNSINARITWGQNRQSRKTQSSIRLGSYLECKDGGIIRIHPVLDSPRVLTCVIEYIVFHEMLHQVFGVSYGNKHPKQFSAAEKKYRHWRKATNWEKKNLAWLLGKERQLAFHLPRE